jgi:hypothetical protein
MIDFLLHMFGKIVMIYQILLQIVKWKFLFNLTIIDKFASIICYNNNFNFFKFNILYYIFTNNFLFD